MPCPPLQSFRLGCYGKLKGQRVEVLSLLDMETSPGARRPTLWLVRNSGCSWSCPSHLQTLLLLCRGGLGPSLPPYLVHDL